MNINDIRSVAVLGLGTMGHGIAQTFSAAGYSVHCYDEQPLVRKSLHERITENLRTFVKAGLLASSQVELILARLVVHDDEADAVAQAQFVTEAVKEDIDAKRELFARLEGLVAPGTILASNSSTFPISDSGRSLLNRGRALVTHWFNPPHLVPLVEVVPGPDTREETVRLTMELMQRIGKRPLWLRKELPGFLVNRIQVAIQREVWDLLDQGVASAAEIDEALQASVGFRMAAVGPLEVHDFGGLDIQTAVFRNLAPEINTGSTIPAIVQKLIDQGRLGAKVGSGFYEYSPERLHERQTRRDRLFLALLKLLYADSDGGRP